MSGQEKKEESKKDLPKRLIKFSSGQIYIDFLAPKEYTREEYIAYAKKAIKENAPQLKGQEFVSINIPVRNEEVVEEMTLRPEIGVSVLVDNSNIDKDITSDTFITVKSAYSFVTLEVYNNESITEYNYYINDMLLLPDKAEQNNNKMLRDYFKKEDYTDDTQKYVFKIRRSKKVVFYIVNLGATEGIPVYKQSDGNCETISFDVSSSVKDVIKAHKPLLPENEYNRVCYAYTVEENNTVFLKSNDTLAQLEDGSTLYETIVIQMDLIKNTFIPVIPSTTMKHLMKKLLMLTKISNGFPSLQYPFLEDCDCVYDKAGSKTIAMDELACKYLNSSINLIHIRFSVTIVTEDLSCLNVKVYGDDKIQQSIKALFTDTERIYVYKISTVSKNGASGFYKKILVEVTDNETFAEAGIHICPFLHASISPMIQH